MTLNLRLYWSKINKELNKENENQKSKAKDSTENIGNEK